MKRILITVTLLTCIFSGVIDAKRIVRAKIKRNNAFELTLSLFKADVGSIGGRTKPTSQMMEIARSRIMYAVDDNTLIDGFVFHIGDDICMVLSHEKGSNNDLVHNFAHNCFTQVSEIAKKCGCLAQQQAVTVPCIVEFSFQHSLEDSRPIESFMVFATHKNETVSGSIWDVLDWNDQAQTDSIALVRTQGEFANTEEFLTPFVGSQLLPVPIDTAATGPRGIGLVCCVGFSINKNGQFSENYVDFFDNPAWDYVRFNVQARVLSDK